MAAEVASYSGFHYKFYGEKKEKKMMIRRNRHTTFNSILVMSCTFNAQHRENIRSFNNSKMCITLCIITLKYFDTRSCKGKHNYR